MLGWSTAELKDHARSLLRAFARDLNSSLALNLRWQDGPAKVLAAIAERLGLPAKRNTND
jgi:hypothetical protein